MDEQVQTMMISPHPITLPSRPTCSNCIAWSDELVAVAGGEAAHIIDTTKDPWRLETIRVNEFNRDDFEVDIAPQVRFSIGREQSTSTVVALAWSSKGLGIHKRPVLAILSSSHVLSFWEYTGTNGTWRRTCIINNVSFSGSTGSFREQGRSIYAFVWLPPLSVGAENGAFDGQFLALIDGDQNLWVVKTSKSDHTSEGVWQLGPLYQQSITFSNEGTDPQPSIGFLGADVPTFDELHHEEWKNVYDDQGNAIMSRIRLIFRKQNYRPDFRGHLSAMLTVEPEEGRYALNSRMSGFAQLHIPDFSPLDFAGVIADPANRYDKDFKLHGHYAVRWMGFARSPDDTMMAACVSFHPSAGLEYSQPKSERSTLLVIPTGTMAPPKTAIPALSDVQLETLQTLAQHVDIDSITTDTDIKVILVAVAMIHKHFYTNLGLMSWATSALELVKLVDSEENTYFEGSPTEICEICRAYGTGTIAFGDDTAVGVCETGHKFTRCGITFLCIQDPGICKYCTKCSRAFLCIEKLESEDGPSVTKTLLETCGGGLCPYCQGYFRD
ncbi:uncharacterized protein HMPREF1541_03090 [Cyphellophora europaea CBS 101466]|uniref:Transcription factor IIIC 90kDa subunit N-terminal domain-containing protein n=1 Tax=Cyphellophora europaea (strain CBS 101466) TaxID=1220924 RepID=W2RXV2_CYPE1|nr:uncharacterized protein HMPREF1541_03090 [Cyphellophora europaea CBS 101466]ETN41155.1 hypothetical protein HMPREF1541_03090 [Cyphellophora europaea CBS 101466]